MRKIFPSLFFLFMLICGISLSSRLFAQDVHLISIKGIVTDSLNRPLLGVTVQAEGAKNATQTNAEGEFNLKVPSGTVLLFTFIGYENKRVTITNGSPLAIHLQQSTDEKLDQVVVTAMDIKRNTRELGYSVQTVSGKDIKESQRENFINSLEGRVAGLTINPTSGQAGASSQIVLRGFNSLSLNNQPLFIIDGVIVDNTTFNETSNGGSGIGLADDRPNRTNDYTNPMADINPNDIASVTVLKGPEATALYGSSAGSGAIVITTKRGTGNGRVNVSYDNSFRFDKITRFAPVFNGFSNGTNGAAQSFTASGGSFFGPAYPTDTTIYDNVGNFFKTGFANLQNIAVDFGTKNVGFRLSGSYFDNKGTIPNNTYSRSNIKLSNSTKLWKSKIVLTPSIEYSSAATQRPSRGAGGYMLDLYTWPTVNNAKNYLDPNGNKLLLDSNDTYNSEKDNPFFSAYRNYSHDTRDRWIATMGVDLKPIDWLLISGRFGYDTYQNNGYILTDPQSYLLSASTRGALSDYFIKYKGYNQTITATATKQVKKFNFRLMVGSMWQDYETDAYSVYGTQLKDSANRYYHSGDSSNIGLVGSRLARNYFGLPNMTINRQIAYFGEFSVSYNNLVYLSYTERFESSSVFPKENRNYNYPGFSLSAILSDIVPSIKGKFLNYLKLRASRAQTARTAPPYSNQAVFVNNYASSPIPVYSYGYTNNNPNLQPEMQKTFETGLEARLLNDRISFEASYYNTHNLNQISVQYRASYATGYILNTQNAAETRNQGIEATLGINPIRKKDFSWDINFNFNHMWSNVIGLPASLGPTTDYYISDTWVYANVRGGLLRNHSTTLLTGFDYARNNNGQILINATTGLPIVNQKFVPIGDRNPKFMLGTLNNFRYKNWTLNFLWDLKVGGDVWNGTEEYLTYIGKSDITKDRMTARVVKGVLKDGNENSANPTVNTISVTPFTNNNYYSETLGMPDAAFIQKNINYLRLRDITLSYNLPQNLIHKIRVVKSLSIFFTGNDLVLITNYRGADPSVSANTAGSMGISGFGMDYGNVATPVSYNFGLRANF